MGYFCRRNAPSSALDRQTIAVFLSERILFSWLKTLLEVDSETDCDDDCRRSSYNPDSGVWF